MKNNSVYSNLFFLRWFSYSGLCYVNKGSVVNKFFFLFVDSRTLGYAEAVYDYAATATSQLSLCRGDRVAILSKTGSDKGWWKGEHCGTGKVCHLFALYNNLFHIMYSWTCLVWHQFNQLYCVIWHWISNSIFFFSGGGGIHCKFQHPVFISKQNLFSQCLSN